jgi:trimethylamine--corrinoid protein Co-methyltransferase
MRYGTSCIGAIESHLLAVGYNQIGKALGLPTASNIGQSDSKRVDSQSGLESGIGISIAALAGINLSRGPGMLAFANCQSYEKLVIDNNICGTALRMLRGVECNEETIGLEIIKSAGRGAKGHLSSAHTLKWFKKEIFFPTDIIDRRSIQTGVKSSTAWERAKEEVIERLTEYTPVPLPEDQVREIKGIMRNYAKSKGVTKLPDITGTGWDG